MYKHGLLSRRSGRCALRQKPVMLMLVFKIKLGGTVKE